MQLSQMESRSYQIHNDGAAKVEGLIIHDILIRDLPLKMECCAIGHQVNGESGLGHTRLLNNPPTNQEFREHPKYRQAKPSTLMSTHIVFGQFQGLYSV